MKRGFHHRQSWALNVGGEGKGGVGCNKPVKEETWELS